MRPQSRSRTAVKVAIAWCAAAQGAAEAREATVLAFEVSGGKTASALAMRDGQDIFVEPQVLRDLGLAPPTRSNGDLVSLRAVAGLAFQIDEARSAVVISCEASCYAPQVLGQGEEDQAGAFARPLSGLVLNYDVAASSWGRQQRVGALLESVLAGDGHFAEVSGVADSVSGFTRLESAMTFDRRNKRTSVRLGDSVSAGGGWGLPLRYGGVKFGTDFSLDPRFISFPSPALSGNAALPSAVDVYVDGALRDSRRSAPGPFTIDTPPIVSGAGVAQVVVTDALGRQQVSAQSFYVAPNLLKDGLVDYAIDLGAERRNYGARTSDYGDLFAAASVRRGFGRGVTGGARVEMSEDVSVFGASISGANYILGEGEATLAASQSPRGEGAYGRFAWARVSRSWSASMQIEAAERGFEQLGAEMGRAARRRAAASVGWGRDANYSLSVVDVRGMDRTRARIWSAGYSRPLGRSAQLSAAMLFVERPKSSVTFTISTSFGLGARAFASAQAQRGPNGARMQASAQHGASPEGGLGWSIGAASGVAARQTARIEALGAYGEGEVEASVMKGEGAVRAGARGGLVYAGDALFATKPVHGGFALVEALPKVDVEVDNRPLGRTNARGRLLVSNLRENEPNTLGVNVDQTPLDTRIAFTKVMAQPSRRGGALVRFPMEVEESRWIVVQTAEGAAPSGVLLTRTDGAQFFVGEEGRAFVASNPRARRLSAEIGGKSCVIELDEAGEVKFCRSL
jgi:outer membrane usher protein